MTWRGLAVVAVALGCVVALSGSAAHAAGLTFTVRNQDDATIGVCDVEHCSLREAITAANAAPGHDTIVFNIPGAGVHTIIASSAPPIIDSPVTIDAATEPGYAGSPLIEFRGTGVPGANGLWFNLGTATSTVRGMALTSWEGAGVLTQASTTVVLVNNYLGMSPDGVTARPNQTGITFLGGSNHIVDGNLISGNMQAGLRIQDVTGTTVRGNRIGTNAAGTAARANSVGIEITPTSVGASGIAIGGVGAGQGNLVSGNSTEGIRFWPSTGRPVTGTTIKGNRIGTDVSGGSALANGNFGIQIRGFGNGPTTGTQIGGTAAGEGNTIAFNASRGVFIETNGPSPENVGNAIRGNAIHSNGSLGIDLGVAGVNTNDALDADGGANGLQNFPVLQIMVNGTLAGELDSAPNQNYSIDLYSSPACDGGGNGEGQAFVESLSVTTNGSGHANFSTAPTLPFPDGVVTATATDLAGSTSEFSACFDVASGPQQPGPTFTVNTTADAAADSGCSPTDCTLREAIVAANTQAGANAIAFDFPGVAHTITPATALPPILETLTIDGETEPEFLDTPVVEIDGTVVSGGASGPYDGLRVEADDSVVRGLVINRFSNGAGIVIESAGNLVEGSFVGTNTAGTGALPNFNGVQILGADNTVGGATDAARNVISGNESENVVIDADGAFGNDVAGNYVGLTATGLGPLGGDGISIRDGASDNTIGGNDPALGNFIAGNVGTGVEIFGSATAGNVVEFNFIGLGATGLDGPGNEGPGVEIVGPVAANTVRDNWISLNAHGVVLGGIDLGASSQVVELNRIGLSFTEELLGNTGHGVLIDGSSGASSNNVISANIVVDSGDAGVRVDAASGTANGNRITNNGIRDNGGLGIDLADEVDVAGVTENDPGDTDGGANRFQNFPELTSVTVDAGETTFTGTLNSTAARTFRIEYYRSASAECDPSDFGEGRDSIAGTNVTTDAGGDVSFEHVFAFELEAGEVVTAIAIDLTTGDTSEFSHCTDVTVAPETVYTVNTNNDDSPDTCTAIHCTLREAIEAANGDGTESRIEFDLTDTDILLAGPLPAIIAPVTLDGTSQGPGTVSIDGTTSGGSGLVFAPGSGGSFAEELWLHDFGAAGIRIQSNGSIVQGFQIWNVDDGIVLEDGAGANLVGGAFDGGAGNVIWDFSHYAIAVEEAGANNELAGNTIGIDANGTPQTLQSGSVGIFAAGTADLVIGHNVGPGDLGLATGNRGNVIVRTGTGIFFESDVTGSVLAGNFIGLARTGVATNLGAGGNGLEISSSDGNQIGPGNRIAYNGVLANPVSRHGIRIDHSIGNRIVANSIHSNAGEGISLNSSNNDLEAPTLSAAVAVADGTATVSGEVFGLNGSYFVEFFENTACDALGSGEGETYRGFTTVEILNNASRTFTAPTFPGVASGDILTATLTRNALPEDTSEFSNCVTVADAAPPPAPVLFGAVRDATPGTLGVAGLVDSGEPQAGQLFDVQFYSAPSCDPIAPRTSLGVGDDFLTNQTGIAGFAKDGLTNVPIGTIVFATATRPGGPPSVISNCVVADFNNTSWHTARLLAPTDSQTGALRAAGEGRWFKVPVLPNSRVNVDISGLPADYDLIAFSDIQKAYEELVGTDVDPQIGPNLAVKDLERQGAQTQDDVFNTSQYDSSSWDPTNWDPNLNNAMFSASQWSASQWSASQWSASQWSASQWSASQWSPSQWSASQWSASQWSASQWSASQWSPSQWSSSNPSDPRAFSGAQTASLLAVSAKPGTGDESVSVNTWNNTGDFYFRVQGKNGSFDPDSEFSISVSRQGSQCAGVVDQVVGSTPVAPSGLGTPKTLILTDSRRLDLNTVVGGSTLNSRLTTLKNRSDVGGVVVDVDADLTVRSLNAQADLPQFRSCPFAKNLVASAIKRIVAAYRNAYPSIQYAVVVGDDTVIPFFRYPDPALMGNETLYVPPVADDTTSQASLRLGYILSDDFIASSTTVKRGGKELPVIDLSVGRLVETPQDIAGMLDAYLGTTAGVVPTPTTSLTTGYDFLTDAADKIAGQLSAGIGGTGNRTLITNQGISPGVTNAPGAAPFPYQELDRRQPSKCAARSRQERPGLPRRPLQRERRPCRRLQDEHPHDGAHGCLHELREHDRLQHRLPHGLQHHQRPRDDRDGAARLGAGVRAQAGDAHLGNGLPVRRHRLPRPRRADLRGVRAAAPGDDPAKPRRRTCARGGRGRARSPAREAGVPQGDSRPHLAR